jgi:hypothetical protein
MKRAAIVAFIVLVAIASGVAIFWWAKLPRMTLTPLEPVNTNAAPLEQRSTDAQDKQFTERVLPVFQTFLSTLDQAGISPLTEQPSFNSVRFLRSPDATVCQFLIGDQWAAMYVESSAFRGITHFGQRGPNNPFRAISHANTNALIRLSQNAIKMPETEAKRILNDIADAAFHVDRSKYEKPEIYPEKLFNYDLGLWTVQYRKKGTDPINQLNYALSFSIRATSPTTAVLVSYTQQSAKD